MFSLLGCDKSVEPLERGKCEVEISGYLNKTYSGEAVFENIPNGRGDKLFFLLLKISDKEKQSYSIVQLHGSIPAIGNNKLNNFEQNEDTAISKLIGEYNDSEVEGIFKSTGGNVEIEVSNNSEIRGKTEFPAYENIAVGKGESIKAQINVRAKFYALEGNTGIIIN